MNENLLNFLRPIQEQLLVEIAAELSSLSSAVGTVVACKQTKRSHAVLKRHLEPALVLADADQLKALKVSSAGAFFIDALNTLFDEEDDIRQLHERLERLKRKTALFRMICPDGDTQFETAQAKLLKSLENQLLPGHRETCVENLRIFLQDGDSEISVEREALAECFAQFLDSKLKLAATVAGYHTVHSGRSMLPYDLLQRAEEALALHKSKFSEAVQQRCIERNFRLVVLTEANRALSMLLVAHPQIVHKIAIHVPESTVAGTLTFLQQCLPALEQPPSSGARDHVQYRIGLRYTRMGEALNDYGARFARDLSYSVEQLERFNSLLGRTFELLTQLHNCHTY